MPIRAEVLSGAVDLVHSTDLVLPPTRLPLVATVHDTAAIEMPQLHSAGAVRQTRERIAGLHRASVVITNSQATADALSHLVAVRDVVVVPLAAYPLPAPSPQRPFAQPFLLCVGEVAIRKDHITLLRAFAKADIGEFRLVIVGPAGSASERVMAEIASLRLHDRVVVTGRVDEQALSTLYAHADALCLASRQEGFGIPIVEAMQRGLPVVATDLPAVREVAGPAALLAPPGDVDALARAIESVVTDDLFAARLADAGRLRGREFTLERMVSGTIAAYQRALGTAADAPDG